MKPINLEMQGNGTVITQSIPSGAVLFIALFIAALVGTFYLLRSLGIYKLAKNQGIEKAYIAFIPCVWIYTACKLVGKTRFMGTTLEKSAVWICVAFSFATLLPVVYNFFNYVPLVMYYLEGGTVTIISGENIAIATGSDFNNLFDTAFINGLMNVLYFFNFLFHIAEIIITVTVYIALFKKFWPEHYILAAVLSFLGLFGVFVFAIRNRKAVDFNEYIRNRYYGAGYTPYGRNGYYGGGRGNNYGGTSYGNSSEDKEPFGEFSERPEEPFGEFSDEKDQNKNGKNDDYFQ